MISLVRFLLLAVLILGLLGPSYAQNPLPSLADSWTGIHSYIVFNPRGNFTSEYMQSIALRYDFGWSVNNDLRHDLKLANPSFVNSLYVDATQGSYDLAWFQQNHPEWILYQCDRVTPLQAYDYMAVIPDFSNPDYVNWKWENIILPLTVNPQEVIALDNALLSNDFVPTPGQKDYGHACGAYDANKNWVQKFAGHGSFAEVLDPQYTDAFIAYLANIRDRLHALPTPKLMVVNTNTVIVSNDDARRAALVAAVDAVMVEGAAYGPEWVGDSRKLWLNNIKLTQEMDAAGKGVYGEMRGAGTGEAAIDHAWIQFNLASYLLGKGHHNALRIRAVTELPSDSGIYWPAEFEAANKIGSPCSLMSQVAGFPGTENGLFMREFSGGLSIVNASSTTSYTAILPSGTYTDLSNAPIAEASITVPPSQGIVLLKTNATACTNPIPVISGVVVSNVTAFTATISWDTDAPMNSQVEFTSPCPTTGCLTALVAGLTTAHTVNVTGLLPTTTYTYRVKSNDPQGNQLATPYQTFNTGGGDANPPGVSAASVTDITSSGVTVSWTTDEPANGQVEFITPCPTSGCMTPAQFLLTTAHIVPIGGLSANTFYTFRIRTTDSGGNVAIGPNMTFTSAP